VAAKADCRWWERWLFY